MLRQRIEEASLNSWPALQQILFDGWLLRISNGYSKRANSVNPLYASTMDVDEKVSICEKLYAEKELPTIFRITSISPAAGLDQRLEQRGYRKIDPTLVLYLDIRDNISEPSPSALMRCEQLENWMDFYTRVTGSTSEKHQTHRKMLQAIPWQFCLASLVAAGEIVACGLGVLENEYLGLFDLLTAPQQRRKGFAKQLVASMLSWAKGNGSLYAYLQVERSNEAARGLYARLGFHEAYHYWYRVC